MTASTPALLEARDLGFSFDPKGPPLFAGLHFSVLPGLTLLQGDDGSGKTTLLRLMAGTLAPGSGQLLRHADTLHADDPTDPAADAVPVQAWLAERQARHAAWSAPVAQALIDGFALAEHLGKRMEMLSTGSRRKVNLVAAAASGARLTLLDNPFAALDAPSSRLLAEVLAEAAHRRQRAWVIADYGLSALLAGVPLAGVITLGGSGSQHG